MPAEIVLVRHGETEWSASGKHTSRTDLPLTEAGRERATALGPILSRRSFSLVLVSPLRRARETCALAGLGARADVSDDLREWAYGAYEGVTTAEIREHNPGWVLWRDGCPDGELPAQVSERADQVLERLRPSVNRSDGDAIVFAHGHILRVIAARWIGLPVAGGARLALSAGSISVLGFERETEVIRLWNDSGS